MDIDLLIETYPRLFHMAEAGSWPSIEHHGLLSTTALLDLFEITGPERREIESQRRPKITPISHPKHGQARIRDQKPLIESRLDRCLIGMKPSEWYELLNGQVFFWLTEGRLAKLVNARPYKSVEHDILTLDTGQLLERHAGDVLLAAYNTGTTAYKPPARGRETFQPIADYPYEEWRGKRDRLDAVVELVVPYAVPDVREFVVRVDRRRGVDILGTLWER